MWYDGSTNDEGHTMYKRSDTAESAALVLVAMAEPALVTKVEAAAERGGHWTPDEEPRNWVFVVDGEVRVAVDLDGLGGAGDFACDDDWARA